MPNLKLGSWQYLLLISLFFLSYLKAQSFNYENRYPYHHDEWQHIAITMQDFEAGYNIKLNPYLGTNKPHADMEPGFHLFLAVLFYMPGLDPIFDYRYFAPFCSVLSALAIFLCTYRLSRQYLAGIISVIAFIAIPSNVNLLGKDFFLPLTLSIPLIFLYLLFYIEGLYGRNIKKLIVSAIIFAVMALIYPLSPAILFLPSLILMAYKRETILNLSEQLSPALKYLIYALLILLVSGLFGMVWKKDIFQTNKYLLEILHFGRGWGRHDVIYSLPMLYSLYSSLFALLGFIKLSFDNNYKKLTIFNLLVFFSLGLTMLFVLYEFTIVIPYVRLLYFAMLFLLPLTGVGFFAFISEIERLLHLKTPINKIFQFFAVFVFLLAVFSYNYELNDKYERYNEPVINDNDYRALMWAKANLEKTIFITPYLLTSAVYPVSGHRVISLVPAQLEGGLIQENLDFFSYGCEKQKEVIDKSMASHIISRNALNCGYLREIHYSGDYVYQIT